jgi:uncharacterized protein YndB with AHSA1/START domain
VAVWRFVEQDADGNEYAFKGEYKEIVPPERLAYTFEERGGKTKMKILGSFDSVEDRDEILQPGMEVGANESYDRLAELLVNA